MLMIFPAGTHELDFVPVAENVILLDRGFHIHFPSLCFQEGVMLLWGHRWAAAAPGPLCLWSLPGSLSSLLRLPGGLHRLCIPSALSLA